MTLDEMRVTIRRLSGEGGIGGQGEELLRMLIVFPRYLILVADREGEMKREVKRLNEEGM